MEWMQIPFAIGRERSAKLKSSCIHPHKQSPKWQRMSVVSLTSRFAAASEGTHLSVMHFHFVCAGAKKIFTGLCYLYVFQAILYT